MKKRPQEQKELDELITSLKRDGFTLELLDTCGGCACMVVSDDATGTEIRLTAIPAPEPRPSLRLMRSLH